MSYVFLVDELGQILIDEASEQLFSEIVSDQNLMGQACLWSFDDLIDWSKGDVIWQPL